MTYRFKEFYVPDHMEEGIVRYVQTGVSAGGFLTAILENDLRSAIELADEGNLRNIPAFVAYLYNKTPAECWGSPKKVAEWSAKMGAIRADVQG